MGEAPTFGNWLRQRRKELHLTQQELAERMACSSAMVRKIEAGERVASQQMAETLAESLDIVAQERAAFVQFAKGRLSGGEAERELWQTLHATQPRPTNLARPLTSLIGREQELESLRKLILSSGERLFTLTGPPGIGKTHLSLEAGVELLDYFEDGIFFISLEAINDPDLVPTVIAQGLGAEGAATSSPAQQLALFLGEKQMLLVLDNFEQVLDAALFVTALISSCPRLKVLVTSRESLHVQGEQHFPVPPLGLPGEAERHGGSAQTLAPYPAIELYVQRARAVKPDFVLTNDNAAAIAAICTRLDGIPLAIELAAARIRLFSPQEMLVRLASTGRGASQANSALDSRYSVLSEGPRNLPARQRTLRAAIDWSYKLLKEEEQILFARLGVFVGGFTLSAAQAVCNPHADLKSDIVEGIESLLDKSLLKREEVVDGESRFTMLETLHNYALDVLRASGELHMLRTHHAHYYLSFAEEADAHLDSEHELLWVKRLDQAYENIRAAISWSTDNEVGADVALRLAGALQSFWLRRGYVTDARNLLNAALAQADEVRSPQKAGALYVAGRLASIQGDHPASHRFLSQSLELYRELEDREGMGLVLQRIGSGYINHRIGDKEQARRALDEAVGIAREMGKPQGISDALGHQANFIVETGNYREARPLFEESLALARQAQDRGLVGSVLLSLGDIARLDGDLAKARSIFEESVALYEASGVEIGLATAQLNLVHVAVAQGDTSARGLLMHSLAFFRKIGHKRAIAESIATFAALHLLDGNLPKSLSLFSAVQGAIDRNEVTLPRIEQQEFEERLAAARNRASEAEWAGAWSEGEKWTLEQAAALALETQSSVTRV
jgi:predicted ATPase/DNA-binding XRE family transcriptional regulator